MTYQIDDTSNNTVTTVSPGTLKVTNFGIRIPGKNFPNYGEAIGEDLVWMIENFACPNVGNQPAPVNPSVNLTQPRIGQLWYDTTNNLLKICYQNSPSVLWNTLVISNGPLSGSSFPSAPLVGQVFYKTSTTPGPGLFYWDGSGWVHIGNQLGSGGDTIFFDVIAGNPALVIKVGNLILGIWYASVAAAGTLGSTYNPLFPNGLNVGLNLSNVANNKFRGNATNSDALGGLSSSQFIRSDASTPGITNGINVGQSSNRFGTIFSTVFDGTALQARYADVAEKYKADKIIGPGNIVSIGGTEEITVSKNWCDNNVLGVISTAPALLMNNDGKEEQLKPAVALLGRVPCFVIGKVKKGDRIISSGVPGVGCSTLYVPDEPTITEKELKDYLFETVDPNWVVGRALHDKNTDGIELLEIIVGVK